MRSLGVERKFIDYETDEGNEKRKKEGLMVGAQCDFLIPSTINALRIPSLLNRSALVVKNLEGPSMR